MFRPGARAFLPSARTFRVGARTFQTGTRAHLTRTCTFRSGARPHQAGMRASQARTRTFQDQIRASQSKIGQECAIIARLARAHPATIPARRILKLGEHEPHLRVAIGHLGRNRSDARRALSTVSSATRAREGLERLLRLLLAGRDRLQRIRQCPSGRPPATQRSLHGARRCD